MNRNSKERSLFTEKEQEEDFIEALYLLQQKGCLLTRAEVCRELNMSKREYRKLSLQLMQQECLKMNLSEEEPLALTVNGNVRAQELLRRHHYLTDFVQLICKVDKKTAEENACRIEHVITSEVFCGIMDYMKNGSHADRVAEGWDINRFYDPGSYDLHAGIYLPGKRYPRMLAPEHFCMGGSIRAEVGEESFYKLQFTDAERSDRLWYLEEHQWKPAEQENGAYRIPTRIFRYTICEQFPVSEGDACIAFSGGEAQPDDQKIRELNVHLW